jgi:hypothetical protein
MVMQSRECCYFWLFGGNILVMKPASVILATKLKRMQSNVAIVDTSIASVREESWLFCPKGLKFYP